MILVPHVKLIKEENKVREEITIAKMKESKIKVEYPRNSQNVVSARVNSIGNQIVARIPLEREREERIHQSVESVGEIIGKISVGPGNRKMVGMERMIIIKVVDQETQAQVRIRIRENVSRQLVKI